MLNCNILVVEFVGMPVNVSKIVSESLFSYPAAYICKYKFTEWLKKFRKYIIWVYMLLKIDSFFLFLTCNCVCVSKCNVLVESVPFKWGRCYSQLVITGHAPGTCV